MVVVAVKYDLLYAVAWGGPIKVITRIELWVLPIKNLLY